MSNLRYSDYYDVKDRAARVERILAGSSARSLIDAEFCLESKETKEGTA